MDQHRCTQPNNVEILSIERPFSGFEFVEKHFHGNNACRRMFSLARSFKAISMVLESIEPNGNIEEENAELALLFSGYRMEELVRLSFWDIRIDNPDKIKDCSDCDLVGYAILKRDIVPSKVFNRWHVFESVFKKYEHPHNCVPHSAEYSLKVGEKEFKISGLIYCQQNALNKSCAHVALRSLLSRVLPEGDISYSTLNKIARMHTSPDWLPEKGLSVPQIRGILNEFSIGFRDIDYTTNPKLKDSHPYQKFAYAGLEAGNGSLVGFKFAGKGVKKDQEDAHIIPFFGHTFNKDTWAPDADVAYFHIGEEIGYIPSESWTSSFLGHDDNFGSNFCIPRLYINPNNVDYVVELFRNGVKYSGVQAEAVSLDFLYSVIPTLPFESEPWLRRLCDWANKQRIVLRAISLSKDEYAEHLNTLKDWENRTEDRGFSNLFHEELPEVIWMIEISTQQLFPANKRKLGEIVLDATVELESLDEDKKISLFLFARLPGRYMFGESIGEDGIPNFSVTRSLIHSHTPLYLC